jgi:hypothetical protein
MKIFPKRKGNNCFISPDGSLHSAMGVSQRKLFGLHGKGESSDDEIVENPRDIMTL